MLEAEFPGIAPTSEGAFQRLDKSWSDSSSKSNSTRSNPGANRAATSNCALLSQDFIFYFFVWTDLLNDVLWRERKIHEDPSQNLEFGKVWSSLPASQFISLRRRRRWNRSTTFWWLCRSVSNLCVFVRVWKPSLACVWVTALALQRLDVAHIVVTVFFIYFFFFFFWKFNKILDDIFYPPQSVFRSFQESLSRQIDWNKKGTDWGVYFGFNF